MPTESSLPNIALSPKKIIVFVVLFALFIIASALVIKFAVIGNSVEATITDPVQYAESIEAANALSEDLNAISTDELGTTKETIDTPQIAQPDYEALSALLGDTQIHIDKIDDALEFVQSKLDFIQSEQKHVLSVKDQQITDLNLELADLKKLVEQIQSSLSKPKSIKKTASKPKVLPRAIKSKPSFSLASIKKWDGISVATVNYQTSLIPLRLTQQLDDWIAKSITANCLVIVKGKSESRLCLQ